MGVMCNSWVLGLRHSYRTSRWRHRVPLAFPVLARGGGRWGRARSAGHQASRASPAPRAALVSARRAPERARASRPRRGDLLPIRLDPMPAVRGCAALVAARCPRGRDAAGCGRCAMVVVLSRSRPPPNGMEGCDGLGSIIWRCRVLRWLSTDRCPRSICRPPGAGCRRHGSKRS